jgi:hypothetical protein
VGVLRLGRRCTRPPADFNSHSHHIRIPSLGPAPASTSIHHCTLIVLCSLTQLTATSNQQLDRPAKCTRGPRSAVSIPPCATFCNAALCIQSEAHHQRCRTTYHVHVLHSLSRSQSPSNSAQRNTPLSLALGASFFPCLACTRPSASMNPRMPSCPAAQMAASSLDTLLNDIDPPRCFPTLDD